jgi:hypothetical protein
MVSIATRWASCCAWVPVIPGLSRPTMLKFQLAELPGPTSSSVKPMGSQSSLWFRRPGTRGNSKSRGMTPMIS